MKINYTNEEVNFIDFFDALPDAGIIMNARNVILFINSQTEQLFGYKRNELINKDIKILIPEAFHQTHIEHRENYLKNPYSGHMSSCFETIAIKKDGSKFPVEISLSPLKTELDTLILITIRDITIRKFEEKKILQISQAVEQSPASIVITDTSGNIQYVNKKFVTLTGYSAEEAMGKNPSLLKSGETSETEYAELWKCIASGLEWQGEFHNKKKNGENYWESALISPIIDEEGKITNFLAIKEDITELRKTEKELEEKEFFLRESQKAGNIGSYKLDFNSGYWQSSETLDNIFGIDKNYSHSIQGWLDFIHPEDKQTMDEYLRLEVIGKRKSFNKEYQIIKVNDKQVRWVLGMGEVKIDDSGNVIEMIGTIQDITERKKAEDEIRLSNEWYEYVNKATRDTIWEWDYRTEKGKWGEGIINTFGYTEENLTFGIEWLDKYIHPSDVVKVRNGLDACKELGIENWQDEYRFLCADGIYKYVYDRGFILFDTSGKPYRMIGAITDATEYKRLERKLVQNQIEKQRLITEVTIQSQERERNEIGKELHDNVNQILATVKMYLGMIKSEERVSEELIEKSYEYVTNAMEEIRKLTHTLVAPSLGDIGLHETLKELINEINIAHKMRIQLIDETNPGQPLDKKMELMLYRIIQEQMNNIIKYSMADETVISLRSDDNTFYLFISDNGVGFDTTRSINGIGLRNIKSRVEFYSGNMNIISAPGKGCTLEVNIPLKIQTVKI